MIIDFFADGVKSSVRNETVELWDLLKKTQSKVNSIENDIERVKTENIHQEQGFINIKYILDLLNIYKI